MTTLLLTVGLPGAGKTTRARQSAAESNALRLTPDEWMIPLFGESDAGGKRDLLEARLLRLALDTLRMGVTVVLDFGCRTRDERSALRWLAEDAGGSFGPVYLPVDEETQRARIAHRQATAAHRTYPVSERDSADWRALFQEPDAAEIEGEWIDDPPAGWIGWAQWAADRWPSFGDGWRPPARRERALGPPALDAVPAPAFGGFESLHAITAANRESWNRIASRRDGRPAAFFRDGGSTLEAYERELAGDVTGKRVLHPACSVGDEVLSWANLGADAIGADISDAAIGKARRKATGAGVLAEFHCADMFDLPAELTDLDLIYLSWGAICWAPDLDVLAGIIVERLRPRGSVLICDHHPLWEVLTVRGENQLAVTRDYFGRGTPGSSPDETKQPRGARGEPEAPAFAAFVWPVSDVVMSLVRAGLRLDAFFEAAEPAIYPDLGNAAVHLPAYYAVKATKTS
jgi:predicted kinase/SAM-dependent methyltransferase